MENNIEMKQVQDIEEKIVDAVGPQVVKSSKSSFAADALGFVAVYALCELGKVAVKQSIKGIKALKERKRKEQTLPEHNEPDTDNVEDEDKENSEE